MPTNGSRTQPTRGSITPPFPSPPITAFMARMPATTFASPDGRPHAFDVVFRRDVLHHPATWTC